ncbi:50S ribosomal protein L11 methyltransferase [Fluviispira multicolorata]|uniref:Ribosomal protein L11 methyltransferase n=1 Tax=Fluviispira multicolorata TaxID=2654512 RepID=A0A833N0G8_9BACT|nr:50S ribosomal protein L11 methyltransferase [Fluviispira multicolorata]KAB8028547.1 methyltransferase domain-containing protein [Fluviispira multicolorata]
MTQNNDICYELKINMSEENKDILAELLAELDIHDFVLGTLECDVEAEYNPLDPKHDYYTELAHNIPVILYSNDREYLLSIQNALTHLLPKVNIPCDDSTFVIQPLTDQDWKESWKASFRPIFVKDIFAIIPPWEKNKDFSQKYKIVIDPGMAFGTGQHETTRLCLETMLEYKIPLRVMDVGTGSGILAIAAQKLGASSIIANDLDPDCMRIAEENARVNLSENIQFTNTPIEEIEEFGFEMIIANIQSRPLKMIMPSIKNHVADKGIIILSGILVSERDDFLKFLEENNIIFLSTHSMGDWCSIVCTK